MEVREIVKAKNGSYTIRGVDRTDIPYSIDNANLPSNVRRLRWFLLILVASIILSTISNLIGVWAPR
jgi:hypothetical protein